MYLKGLGTDIDEKMAFTHYKVRPCTALDSSVCARVCVCVSKPMATITMSVWRCTHLYTHIYYVCMYMCAQEAARQGVPPAMYNLGNMFAAGVGVAQSDESAMACYEGAAG